MDKRAQGLFDFMVTYGWAILVILVAIGAVIYMGVLEPKAGSCKFTESIECLDSIISGNGTLTIALRNSVGYPITISKQINVTGDCNTTFIQSVNGVDIFPALINSTSKTNLLINCGAAPKDKFKAVITLNYENTESGLSHVSKGVVYHVVS